MGDISFSNKAIIELYDSDILSLNCYLTSETTNLVTEGFLENFKKPLIVVNTSNKNKVKGIIDSFSATRQTCFIQPISLVELNNKLNGL